IRLAENLECSLGNAAEKLGVRETCYARLYRSNLSCEALHLEISGPARIINGSADRQTCIPAGNAGELPSPYEGIEQLVHATAKCSAATEGELVDGVDVDLLANVKA